MALTPSQMLPLGTIAPDFTLPDTRTGKMVHLQEIRSDIATLILFICNHCPYVKHVQEAIVQLANDYIPKGISVIAISANDVKRYPEDGPGQMKAVAEKYRYTFPYLYDETQETARAYDAACTPDFFIFDGNLRLVYRGQLDDSRPGNHVPLTGKDIRAALNALLSGEPVSDLQKPSIGCSIKWKSQ